MKGKKLHWVFLGAAVFGAFSSYTIADQESDQTKKMFWYGVTAANVASLALNIGFLKLG